MNNENLKPVQELTPFTKMIMTIGVLPTSFYSSMSYYESMVWLYEYLKNQVIPAVNNNAEAVEELQEKYIEFTGDITEEVGDFKDYINGKVEELETYMNNYFNNLDVQQEINNKLDQMALDGSLTALIKAYVDPIYEAYEETITGRVNDQDDEISNFKNSINSQIAIIDNKVDSATSGTPKGVYASVSDLTTADPSHDYIYVVTADGNWYYYDTANSQWTAGGTYQATSIADNSIIPSQLEGTLKRAIDYVIPTYTIIDNKYRAGSSVYDNNAFALTDPIEVKANHTINAQVKGYGSNITILCIVDSEGNYIRALQQGETSVASQINYTAYKDCYVSICYLKDYGIQNLIIYNNLDSNIEKLNNIDFGSPVLNHYINSSGGESTYSGGYAMATDYIEITENTKYLIKGIEWETADNIGTGFYDKNKKFISFTKNTQTDDIELTSPTNAVYMRLTLANKTLNKTRLIIEDTLAEILNKSYNKENFNFSIGVSDNIICCGDSLTYGLTYTANGNVFYRNYYNYPYFLKRLVNNSSVTWKAAGGMTSSSWWSTYSANLNETETLFIVWLCTNDQYTDSVATDCAGNDYTQFADTETGNLGKIVGKILSLTGNKVILVNQFAENQYQETNNKVINDIATKFSVPVIDLTKYECNETIYHTAYNGYYNEVHFNNKGHCYIANIVNNFINDYNKTNYMEFYKEN